MNTRTNERLGSIKRRLEKRILWPLISPLYVDYDPDYRKSVFLAGTEKSGTTWISDLINYRREYRFIFEPFWGARVDMCRHFQSRQYLRPDNHDRRYIEPARAILSGRVRNGWTDKYHRRFIANQRLIKDIRANLFLKWIHNHFPEMPIILLLRHPCAVARSHLRRTSPEPNLSEFLAQEELMVDYLNPFREELAVAQTTFEKLIFRWCVENYVPLMQFRKGEIHLAFYENFCETPESEINRLFSFLGKSYDEAVFADLSKPSPVSREESAIMSGGSLIDGWRKQITEEQTRRAVGILRLFGLNTIYSQKSMPNVNSAYDLMGH